MIIPLSLYIHFPWCVRKCPYCDFNSYTLNTKLEEKNYINVLLKDLDHDLQYIQNRKIISIFMGGGTPSLFSAESMQYLLDGIRARLQLENHCEITMEMNPGGVEHGHLPGYREAGINRLSIGIQSFQIEQLKKLGRVHNHIEAIDIVHQVKAAGFDNINLDLMYALPQQSVSDALQDLQQAIDLKPQHLSWYHLTIEPNTEFYRKPPQLPDEEISFAIETEGKAIFKKNNFKQYEVSAYSAAESLQSQHNRNYWEFGDYLGIGAGAHSKITDLTTGVITRYTKHRTPQKYVTQVESISSQRILSEADIKIEFLLNALRLTAGFSKDLFKNHTYLPITALASFLQKAKKNGLLNEDTTHLIPTPLGARFLNDLMQLV